MRSRPLATLAGCALLALAPVASAHSGLASTSPANGAVARALPPVVTLTFEGRLARVSRVTVRDSAGANHAASARLDPRNARRVLVTTAKPVAGRFVVAWSVVSEDGHPESGTFAFRARGS